MSAGVWIATSAMFLAGVGIPVMAMLNGAFGVRFGPPTAALATFGVAFCCASLVAYLQGLQPLRAMAIAPWYMVFPGLIVAFYMLSITHFGPMIGLGTAVILVVLGQVACAVAIDHFGMMGLPKTPVSWPRLTGVLLIVAGVALARG